MKYFLLIGSILFASFAGYAQTYQEDLDNALAQFNANAASSGESMNTLVQYLGNLGLNLGYNLSTNVNTSTVIDTLLTYLSTSNGTLGQEIFEQTAFWSLLGAIPVDAYSQTLSTFVPQSNTYASIVNAQSNYTFPNYSSASQTIPSVITSVDQPTYQTDPVSQAVLNIMTTPDYSFCSSSSSSSSSSSTSSTCLSQLQVMQNILQDISSSGSLPGAGQAYTYSNAQPFLSQLNANVLIAPLLYSTTSSTSSDSSSSQSSPPGIPSATQAQQASNFIRYATAGLSPNPMMTSSVFSSLWTQAYDGLDSSGNPLPASTSGAPVLGQDPAALQAQVYLTNWFTSMRVFAAQSSVAIGNLYEILARRLPQTDPNNSTTTSRALSEFQLASWRLYNPQNSNQWITEINTASAATVQKESAILLAEINYQLYLNRQLEERILLTNSLMLLQQLSSNPPSPQSNNTTTSSANN